MGGPLILTLRLDRASAEFYEALRQRYFPPERNLIPAHLTLFHQLPDEDRTYAVLHASARATAPCALSQPRLRSLGRGVAVFFHTEPLLALHRTLAQSFADDLIPQDLQRFQPHIVIQNKVDGATARQTLAELERVPMTEARGVGLVVWRYLGGPWEFVEELPFGVERE